MNSLKQSRAPLVHEMPRFDDGMVNIQEFIRIMAESIVSEIMDVQAEDACADGNQRNGYRERTLMTSVGAINLRIPKLRRGSYFPEDLIVRYSRVDRAVIAAVSEMVTCGVSTRKVERVAGALGIDRMSASQVSGMCESMDDAVAAPQGRGLSEAVLPDVWGGCHLHQVPQWRPCAVLRAVFDERDSELVREPYPSCPRGDSRNSPSTADLLEDAEADARPSRPSPMPTIGACAPTTCRSVPTKSWSARATRCRRSRPEVADTDARRRVLRDIQGLGGQEMS